MKKMLLTIALLNVCALPALGQDAVQVKDEQTYRSLVTDKKWQHSWGKTWVKVNSDGTFEGDSPNGKLKGTWYWKGSKWCRTGQVGKTVLKEECQKMYMIGSHIMKNVTKNAPKGNYYYAN